MHADPPAPQLQTPLFPGLCAPTHHTYVSTYPSTDTCVSPQPAGHEQCGCEPEGADRPARPWFQFFGINTQEWVPRPHGTYLCNFPGSSIVFSIVTASADIPTEQHKPATEGQIPMNFHEESGKSDSQEHRADGVARSVGGGKQRCCYSGYKFSVSQDE